MSIKRNLFAVAALLMLSAAVGCGGSGDLSPVPSPAPSVSANITRATESTFSESARILAARSAAVSGATWLSADEARGFDADLKRIKATFAFAKDIVALSDYDLRTVVVAVRPNAPFLPNWNAGRIATGDAGIDALFAEFAPEQVTSLGQPIEGGTQYFTLRFGQSLNMVKLAERLRAASVHLEGVDPNYTAGDGNNIKVTAPRRYAFSRGTGDCPAGCIYRHTQVYEVPTGDGVPVLVEETGAPVPQE